MTYPNPLGGGTLADAASGYLANYMPIIWAKKTLDFVEKQLVLWKCIDTSWESELPEKGDTIRINPLLEVSAQAVNTFKDPTDYNTDQGAYTDIIINMWYETTPVSVTDAQTLMGSPDYEKRIVPKLGYAIAKQIDTSVATVISNTDTPHFTNGVGTEGAATTYDTLLGAKAYLDLADAPEDGRFLIIDPATLTDLMQDDRFTSTLYNAGGAVQKGWIGQARALNCTVLMTNNLTAVNTSYHGAAMFQREAIAGVMRQGLKYAIWREERRHATYHRATALWGLIIMRNTFGCHIHTRA